MGPLGFPETSVENYHSTLRNIPEGRRSEQPGIVRIKFLYTKDQVVKVYMWHGDNKLPELDAVEM
jgi:hypothetical protein